MKPASRKPTARRRAAQFGRRSFVPNALPLGAFPSIRDLAVDRIIAAGGYISTRAGSAPEANSILVAKEAAEASMDAAACIGCGACVAQCPNPAAALFTGAKISQLGLLPQGQPERWSRVCKMVAQCARQGFGSCTNIAECEAVCPKSIKLGTIARMNRDYLAALWKHRDLTAAAGAG